MKSKVTQKDLLAHCRGTLIYFVPTIAATIYTVVDKTLIGIITKDNIENGCYEQATKIISIIRTISFTSMNTLFSSRTVSYTHLDVYKRQTFGPAMQPYDFIYVQDLIEAVYRLGEAKLNENFYFIGSGKPRILKEYLAEIGEQCKKSDLIRIGVREDDGIKYTFDMFDTKNLLNDIGDFVTKDFTEGLRCV